MWPAARVHAEDRIEGRVPEITNSCSAEYRPATDIAFFPTEVSNRRQSRWQLKGPRIEAYDPNGVQTT
jgi:hypothetical protein